MLLRMVLAAVAATLIPAATAGAATEIGRTTVSGTACNSGTLLAWQTSATHLAPARGS